MFGWFKKSGVEELEEETRKSFSAVKEDINSIGKWLKHLDSRDKQVLGAIRELKEELVYIREEVEVLKSHHIDLRDKVEQEEVKQVFRETDVLHKQTPVQVVQEAVQTPVQTGNFYEIIKELSLNERAIIMTLINSDMKLSYEDLSLMLGKERSTIRGHINRIKQKSEGLIEEIVEKNGKKRVYIPEEIKGKLGKYAKVRVKKRSSG